MSNKSDAAATSLGIDPNEPIDTQLKRAQLMKTVVELRNLESPPWSFDLISRLAVAVLVVAAAMFTFIVGVPQAKIDLHDANQKLKAAQEKVEAADKSLKEKNDQVTSLEQQRRSNEGSIGDLEAQRLALSRDIERLQTEAAKIRPPVSTASQVIVHGQNVFIQFAGTITRDQIDSLRKELFGAGFSAPPAVRKNSGQKNEVRYLASLPNGQRVASEVQRVVQQVFANANCPLQELPIQRLDATADAVPIELTLMHNCRPG